VAVRRKKILIADDYAQTAQACRKALEPEDLEILGAATVPEASRLLAETSPDCVILDAALPGGSVSEFCAHVRARKSLPLMLLVPPRYPEGLLRDLRPLADDCLFKPFQVTDLRQRVRKLLAARGRRGRNTYVEQSGAGSLLLKEDGAPVRADLCGSEIAGCRLERLLGRGASSAVYLGRHLLLDAPVAVKLLDASAAGWGDQERQRFIRGARAAVQIQHPNVAPVLNAGVERGFYFLVHRYVEGETLKSRIEAETRLDEGKALRILQDVAGGLSAAHRLDIIHRDVKPANIILASSGAAMLTDFGLARAAGRGEISDTTDLVGTPYYMSPEQCNGLPLDARSDLYSLGATGYHALTGRPPILGDSPVAVLRGHAEEVPPSPRDLVPDLSKGVSSVIMKLLSKSPDARYAGAEELCAALARVTASPRSSP
jgi:CheY-like chemotaxis protein